MKLKRLSVAAILTGLLALFAVSTAFAPFPTSVFSLKVNNNLISGGSTYLGTQVLAGAVTLTIPDQGTVFSLTGTASITRIVPPTYPELAPVTVSRVIILCTTSTDTLVDGGNLKLAGNFPGTASDVITLIYNISGAAADTFYTEVSRSVN